MKARSKTWECDPTPYPCACGSRAREIVNLGSKERLLERHTAPDGRLCPEYSWQQDVERTRRICIAAGVAP